MKECSYEEIKSSTKDFSLDHLIGKGSHGYVYKAILKDGKQVAVKRPYKINASKLDNEIEILSSIQNPNLVSIVGYCRGPAHNLLITEFMPNGSLYDFLHSSQNSPISLPRRMLMALQIARAIESLHDANPCIIHRDIKSANILLDRKWNARLADFSLAVRLVPGLSTSVAVPVPAAGTLGYLDPGYTGADKLGPENDVFSFGVLLLEIVSLRKAMDVEGDPASIVPWAVPMIREGRVLDVCDKKVVLGSEEMERLIGRVLSIAARCVEMKEERRPATREVVGELREVVEDVFWCTSWFYKFSRVWKKYCKKKRMTTMILCKENLIKDEDDEDEI